jgi:heptosyltransferase-2
VHYSKILVRATNWVGDAVMSLPALRAIRRRFPDAEIAVLARPWVADLYARESWCSRIIPYTAERGLRDWAGKWSAAARLRREGFDCAILLQNAFEAAFVAWLARIPVRIGYDRDARGMLLTHPVKVPAKGEIPPHQRYYYLELLRRAGIIAELPEIPAIRLEGAEDARRAGQQLLGGAVVGVSPGAAYGSAKRWIPERFAASAAQLAKELAGGVAVFGSRDERELCDYVAHLVCGAGVEARNFAGETTLKQFIEMASACRVFLTNDSGAMHIASAAGAPTITIFGATDPIATGPTGELAHIVREPVQCSPCLLRECPIDHRCMTAVSTERVVQEAVRILQNEVNDASFTRRASGSPNSTTKSSPTR